MKALELITTHNDESAIASRAQLLISTAGRLVIDSQESMERGADTAKHLKSLAKKAEELRAGLVKPFNDSLKEINTRFRKITDPLDVAARDIAQRMLAFTKEQERIAREEQIARQDKEREARFAAMANTQQIQDADDDESIMMPSTASAIPVTAVAVPEITRGTMGATASIVKTWTFEVTDIVALANARPDLVEAVSAKINAEIRGKGGEIPGLRIYQQERMGVR